MSVPAAVCLRVSSLIRSSRRARSRRAALAALTALGLSFAAALPARAQNVQPGLDLFTTPTPPMSSTTSGTYADFSGSPLPAGFFCPGSNPFTGITYFKGSPFNFIDFQWRTTDTIIRRLDTATLPGIGSQDTVPIEIVALSLVSIQPIAVNCPAPNNLWNISVCLSSVRPQTAGSMTIVRESTEGGSFNASLPVFPRFKFTSVGSADTREFDAGMSPVPVLFNTATGHWTYADPGLNVVTVPPFLNVDGNCDGVYENLPIGTSNFIAGIRCVPRVIHGWRQVPVVFSVTRQATEGEGLLQPDPFHLVPNDLYALGHGPFPGLQRGGELFQSSGAVPGGPPDMTNVDRMSAAWGVGPAPGGPPFLGPFLPNPGGSVQSRLGGSPPGTLGLVPADELDAVSFGRDGGTILVFSVRHDANGLPGTAVEFHSTLSPLAAALGAPPSNGGGDPGAESGGDLYSSAIFAPFGGVMGAPFPAPAAPGGNVLYLDDWDLGLQAPAASHSSLGPQEDDLDAVEISDASIVDTEPDGIPDYGDKLVFFSLGPGSPSLAGGATVDDILVSVPGFIGGFGTYADGVSNIGLLPGDDVNALVLWDAGFGGVPNGFLDAGDEALFTLAPGSPSLAAGANPNMPAGVHRPGDVFRTAFVAAPGGITVYATAAALGLDNDDVIDALDIGSMWGGVTCLGPPPCIRPPWFKEMTKEQAVLARHYPATPQCKVEQGSQCLNVDSDGDGLPDDSDNAPYQSNHLQEDADGDSVGDVADDCPSTANGSQVDTDGDHIGDACDNCPTIFDPTNCDDGDPCTTDSCSGSGCTHTNNCIRLCSPGAITINDNAPATPYPSTIVVSGLGPAANVASVEVRNYTQTFPDDVDVLLVGPGGQDATIMSDAGGGGDIANVNLILTDATATTVPDAGPLVSGTFKPANYEGADVFPAPAPAPTGNAALSVYTGQNPNGTWRLFVQDDFAADTGSIGSWCLNLRVTSCSIDSHCSDGNLCNGAETCVSGQCVPGTPVDCDDGQFCTIDACDPSNGACTHALNTCDDVDACTVDRCDNTTLCSHVNVCAEVCSASSIIINEFPATATPYPSTINVAGLGVASSVASVELRSFTHTFPDDIDILLVGPGGQDATIMSDVGGGADIVNTTLTLTDFAAASMPDQAPIVTGTYKPTNAAGIDVFPAPAPPATGNTALSVYKGLSPNGPWRLFVRDDATPDTGTIASWCLDFRMCLCGGSCTPGGPATFTQASPLVIPDNTAAPLTSTLVVGGIGAYLYDVNLRTSITQTFPGDLEITLQSPGGIVTTISTRNGGQFDNVFNGTTWDDDADPGNQVPFPGNTFAASNLATDTVYVNNVVRTALVPEEAMGAFIGENPNGTWTLTVRDAAAQDTGTVVTWSLDLRTLPSAPSEATATYSNMTAVPISAGAPSVVSSTIAVAGAGTHLGKLALRTNISHTANFDLDITLRSPVGTIVTVTSDNGSSFDDVFKGTTWSDGEDPGSQIPYSGNPNIVTDRTYANLVTAANLTIEEGMAAFEGEDPNGIWTLSISDDTGVNGGALNNWSIDVTTLACEQPCANPGEVNSSVVLAKTAPAGSANLSWSDSPGPFHVYRGLRTTMASWSWNQTCLATAVPSPPVPDAAVPAVGTAYYYLVSRCFESSLGMGRDKFGNPTLRPNSSPCP